MNEELVLIFVGLFFSCLTLIAVGTILTATMLSSRISRDEENYNE